MKIRKNLSDAEMFSGSEETYTFENEILTDDSRKVKVRGLKKKEQQNEGMLLPAAAQEKLNRCLLEVSMEWLKAKNGDLDWKVKRDGFKITIEPLPKKVKS